MQKGRGHGLVPQNVRYELACRGVWLKKSSPSITELAGLDWADEDMWGTQGKLCPHVSVSPCHYRKAKPC